MLVEWTEQAGKDLAGTPLEYLASAEEERAVQGWVVASHRTLWGRHMLTVALPSGEVREVPAKDCRVVPFERAVG